MMYTRYCFALAAFVLFDVSAETRARTADKQRSDALLLC
jgi:hypothetical protein